MKILKSFISIFTIFTATYATAQSTSISISNGATENFLWAPAAARYSPWSQPNDFFSLTYVSSDTGIATHFRVSATAGSPSKSFDCYISPTNPIFAKAREIMFSLDESSVLEVFQDIGNTQCKRIIHQKRSDYYMNSAPPGVGGKAETPTINITDAAISGSFNIKSFIPNSYLLAKTNWVNEVEFYAYSASSTPSSFSCKVPTSSLLYPDAEKMKNALGNGYYFIAMKDPAPPRYCYVLVAAFSTAEIR